MVKIYVDLDGVLADWNKMANALDPNIPLVGITNNFSWEELHKKNPMMYRELPLTWDAFTLWGYIQRYDPIILTAIPKRFNWPDVCEQKRDWVHEHFGRNVEVRFGPFAIDKQFHCRSQSDVLIDDHRKNIDQWHSQGGLAIRHLSAAETINALNVYRL